MVVTASVAAVAVVGYCKWCCFPNFFLSVVIRKLDGFCIIFYPANLVNKGFLLESLKSFM